MASNLIVTARGRRCRFKLSFGSYLLTFVSLGLWLGIAGVFFWWWWFLLISPDAVPDSLNDVVVATVVLFMVAVLFSITFCAVFAILSYPLHQWFAPAIYYGEFELLGEDREELSK
jgi:hypothetical protein